MPREGERERESSRARELIKARETLGTCANDSANTQQTGSKFREVGAVSFDASLGSLESLDYLRKIFSWHLTKSAAPGSNRQPCELEQVRQLLEPRGRGPLASLVQSVELLVGRRQVPKFVPIWARGPSALPLRRTDLHSFESCISPKDDLAVQLCEAKS